MKRDIILILIQFHHSRWVLTPGKHKINSKTSIACIYIWERNRPIDMLQAGQSLRRFTISTCNCSLLVTVHCLWLFIACDCSLLVTVHCLWLFIACDCSLLVTVHCLWLFIACDCLLLVTVHCLWLFIACDCSLLVTVHCLWLFIACDCSLLVTVHCLWLFIACDCSLLVTVHCLLLFAELFLQWWHVQLQLCPGKGSSWQLQGGRGGMSSILQKWVLCHMWLG